MPIAELSTYPAVDAMGGVPSGYAPGKPRLVEHYEVHTHTWLEP
jgi:hypothetical protein